MSMGIEIHWYRHLTHWDQEPYKSRVSPIPYACRLCGFHADKRFDVIAHVEREHVDLGYANPFQWVELSRWAIEGLKETRRDNHA